MYVKRKKFKAEISSEQRLSERWDQQVFMARRTHPGIEASIERIIASHSNARSESEFTPTESAITELEALCAEMKAA